MMQTLLPYNATHFERVVEQGLKFKVTPEILAGFKFKTTGLNINLALSWEYSLSQINVDDFRERVIQGLKFHRLRGTPYALRQALTWYDLTGIVIEEENPGRHFAEFQIGFDEVPEGFDSRTVVKAAQLAAPLRSRLSRMYNKEYDIRHFILDQSDWGDLLSDYSGVYTYEDGVKLSFGRKTFCFAEFFEYEGKYAAKAKKYTHAQNDDRFILSYSLLGDAFDFHYYRNNYYTNKVFNNFDYVGDKQPTNTIRLKTFARAQIVLSDSILEDLNACLAGSYEHIEEEPFILSFSFLSENKSVRENVCIDKRLWSKYKTEFAYLYESAVTDIIHTEIMAFEGSLSSNISKYCNESTVFRGQYYGNDTWHDHRHFSVPWTAQNFYTEINGGE